MNSNLIVHNIHKLLCGERCVSYAWSLIGFRSVVSEEIAKYISKQFGKLLFEVSYGGINCDWEWID